MNRIKTAAYNFHSLTNATLQRALNLAEQKGTTLEVQVSPAIKAISKAWQLPPEGVSEIKENFKLLGFTVK